MRVLFACVMVAGMSLAGTPAAAQGSWCAEDMNSRNCGFYTLEQCQAAASGNSARCDFNYLAPRAPAAEPPKRKKRAKHSH
jgi:hypothetical protein